MTNIAQIVNVLHSLLLTEGDKCVRTSTYYVYELLKPHRGKTAVRVENPDTDPLGLSVSASRQGGQMVLTFVNPRHNETMQVECSIAGASAKGGSARVIHHQDWNACNTFESPGVIVPKALAAGVSGSTVKLELPPLAVATATVNV